MFYWIKNSVSMLLLLLSCAAFAQDFALRIYIDKNGNPDSGGRLFGQYFSRYPWSGETVINIGGRRNLYHCEWNCENIRKYHLDAINWEIEKTMRCDIFKIYQVTGLPSYGSDSSMMIDFLQIFPDGSECIAPVFYLWQQVAGKNFSMQYNYPAILAKLGSAGRKYAKIIEENNSQQRFQTSRPVSNKELFSRYTNQPFKTLSEYIRNRNDSDSTASPGRMDYEQVNIIQMLDQKSPPEIVKYLLNNNIINAKNLNWLAFFLEMCPEWPPEAVEFLKKQYVAGDPKSSQEIREKIVVASFKNPEMAHWLKPYMAEFADPRKNPNIKPNGEKLKDGESISFNGMNPRLAAAYMLIAGESDPVKIVRNYVSDSTGFIYEYAYATGKYNDACSLIDKIQAGWWSTRPGIMRDYAMLYDKSDLTTENRIKLLKQLLSASIVQFRFYDYDAVYNLGMQDPSAREFLQRTMPLHPDNLPALLALTKDKDFAANAWLAIKMFPAEEMPPEVAAQCFAHCKQALNASDAYTRKAATRSLRIFTADAQRPQAVKLLLNLLLSSDPSIVFAANDSLTAMGPACMSELLEAIGGSEPYFAARACELIGGMGLYGQKAAPGLLKQLKSNPDWMIKTMIIKTLALIKGADAIPEIEKYVSAEQPMLAATATQALTLLKPIPKEILNDPSDFVRNYNKPAVR